MIKAKERLIGNISAKQTLSGKLNNGIEKVYPSLQEKTAIPSGEIQEITADKGVYGLSKVTVDKVNLQEKSVTPSSSEQIVKADSGYAGLNEVTVNGDDNLIPQNIAEGKSIFNVVGTAKLETEETFNLSTIDPYGIEEIVRNDNYNDGQYSRSIILLLLDSFDTISLKGAVAYKTSDGQFYTPTSYSTEVVHTWDKSKDVVNSKGNKVRWVIFYNANTGLYNSNTYNEVIACIFDLETSINRYGSGYLYNKIPNVEYIKFINVENQEIAFKESFRQLYSLKLVDGLEESYINGDGPYMAFNQCYSLLKFPDIKMSDGNNNAFESFMNQCYKNREIPDLDYNITSTGDTKTMNSAFNNNDLRKIGKFSAENLYGTATSLFANNYNLTEVEEVNLPNATNTSYMFQNDRKLTKIGKIDVSSSTNISSMFYGCISLIESPYMDTSKATNLSSLYYGNKNLVRIKNLDFSSATSVSSILSGCSSLIEIENISNIGIALSVIDCKQLSHDTVVRILNALIDLTGLDSKTLILGDNIKKLSDEEKAIAINKNWTLS